ncbi:transcription termination factor 3, mitochondrial [Hyalella azteca]|uniref:Transcription termination factor 3, mitochondrial n=1 Tax=Hyalella azteca TaxID=294128 RepID=A0A8B7NAK3_HYAAZ|nr:transcription termination factor 3, mitochondrial [Hyalella azteca]
MAVIFCLGQNLLSAEAELQHENNSNSLIAFEQSNNQSVSKDNIVESALTPTEKLAVLDRILPNVPQSFNIVTYVNRSKTLQELIKLGVNISKYDEDTEKASYVLLLDFEKDIKPHLLWLAVLDRILPNVPQSFNIVTYVNRSKTLQELIKLGVNISKYDEDTEKASYVLLLDFEKDIKPHLFFLHQVGVPVEKWARILTINPYLLKEDLDVLHSRIQYLVAKKFTPQSIATVAAFPIWLSHSIESIDSKLGFLQKEFHLSGAQVRAVATRLPRIVFYNQMKVRRVKYILSDEFGFSREQRAQLLVENPRIYHLCAYQTTDKLRLITKKMLIPVDMIVKCNKILTCRLHILDNRHFFLKSLDRAQYNPTLPRYVSPELLATLPDADFVSSLAKSTMEAYHMYLKTL